MNNNSLSLIDKLPALSELSLPYHYAFEDYGYRWDVVISEICPTKRVDLAGTRGVNCCDCI